METNSPEYFPCVTSLLLVCEVPHVHLDSFCNEDRSAVLRPVQDQFGVEYLVVEAMMSAGLRGRYRQVYGEDIVVLVEEGSNIVVYSRGEERNWWSCD